MKLYTCVFLASLTLAYSNMGFDKKIYNYEYDYKNKIAKYDKIILNNYKNISLNYNDTFIKIERESVFDRMTIYNITHTNKLENSCNVIIRFFNKRTSRHEEAIVSINVINKENKSYILYKYTIIISFISTLFLYFKYNTISLY